MTPFTHRLMPIFVATRQLPAAAVTNVIEVSNKSWSSDTYSDSRSLNLALLSILTFLGSVDNLLDWNSGILYRSHSPHSIAIVCIPDPRLETSES